MPCPPRLMLETHMHYYEEHVERYIDSLEQRIEDLEIQLEEADLRYRYDQYLLEDLSFVIDMRTMDEIESRVMAEFEENEGRLPEGKERKR